MPIKVSVKQGEVAIDIEGMTGPGCKSVMEAATAAAQLSDIKDDPKDEFYAEQSADQQVTE